MNEILENRDDPLYRRIAGIIESARHSVARSINTAMVHAYWLIGRELVEHEQGGEARADYGERVVERLSTRLSGRYGRGFSVPNLRRMRQFYLTWPTGSALPEHLKGVQNRSALPSGSEPGKIRSALPSEFVEGGRPLFPPFLGWTHYTTLMRVQDPNARAFYEIEAVREN